MDARLSQAERDGLPGGYSPDCCCCRAGWGAGCVLVVDKVKAVSGEDDPTDGGMHLGGRQGRFHLLADTCLSTCSIWRS